MPVLQLAQITLAVVVVPKAFLDKFCPECPCVRSKSYNYIITECPSREMPEYTKDETENVTSRKKSVQTRMISRSVSAPGTTGEDGTLT